MTLSENIFIGRQPILDSRQEIKGYELLFRSGSANTASVLDGLGATSRVLANVLNNMGTNELLGGKLGFINIDEKFLTQNMQEILPKKDFVLEILETSIISEELVRVLREMKKNGYLFALDDFVFKNANIEYFRPLFDIVNYVKIDVRLNDPETVKQKVGLFKQYRVQLLAEKVETMEEFEFYKGLGFHFFQGFFFAKPIILQGKKIDPAKYSVIEVLQQIQKDQDINILENTFKKYPDLTINLLKFINSAAIAARSKITSVRQAIALLGYRKLMSWLIMLAYATAGDGQSARNPLFLTAVNRAKSMELVIKSSLKNPDQAMLDEAFLTGLLSMLDALFQKPLNEILEELQVGDQISSALLERNNIFGQILSLVENAERDTWSGVDSLLEGLGISLNELNEATTQSFNWVQTMA